MRRHSLVRFTAVAQTAAVLLVAGLGLRGGAASDAGGGGGGLDTEATPVTELLTQLPTSAEHTTGYDRYNFNHWIDADSDGCDTRAEVLIAESTTIARVGAQCAVSGTWLSWYDDATWTSASDVDIDHLVPLQEAWASGAHGWTAPQRAAFANDLDFDPSLAAVTDDVNQAKGARDPSEWLPPDTGAHCRYATEWVLVKYRWRLAADSAEATVLTDLLEGCGDPAVTVPVRAALPAPTPPNPGDSKNCGDFSTWSEAQTWFDQYVTHYGDVAELDSDGDGVACASLPGAP